MISNIFFAMIASIVLVNLLYFVLILYEQWQEYKKDQARQKDVAEHGVLPIMKLIYLKQKQVVASQRKPKQWPSIETDQEFKVLRVRTCRSRKNSRDSCRCSCQGHSLGQKHHLNLRSRIRVLICNQEGGHI